MGFGISGGVIEVDSEKDLPELGRSGQPNTLYYYYNPKGEKVRVETDANGQPIYIPSWQTIKSNYWKSQANDPNSYWYRDREALKGKTPIVNGKRVVLHHPYGRQGASIFIHEEMLQKEHIAFHGKYGYHFYNGEWHHISHTIYLRGE